MVAKQSAALPSGVYDIDSFASDVEGRRLLTFRFIVLHRLISRQASRYLDKHFGLSMAEWWVLGQLGEHSPRTLRQLAEVTYTDKAQLSRASASLVSRGLVSRELDPKDARSVLFSITPEGVALKDLVRPGRREFNQTLLDQLSDEERRALNSAIDKLTRYLQTNIEPA